MILMMIMFLFTLTYSDGHTKYQPFGASYHVNILLQNTINDTEHSEILVRFKRLLWTIGCIFLQNLKKQVRATI